MQVRRKAFHALWKEQDNLVERFLSEETAPHVFLQRLYDVLAAPPDAFPAFVRAHQARFEASLMEARHNPGSRAAIPAITHRIWLTAPEQPRMPPAEYLANYFNMIRELPETATHFFWANSTSVQAAVQDQAKVAGCPNVIILDPIVFGLTPIMVRIGRLIEASKFVLAADVFKIVVLERFGGIYSDLGIVYDRQIFELVLLADYALIVSNSQFFQTSFLASAPGSGLFEIFLAVLNVPAALDPRYALMGSEATALDEVHIFAGLCLTACALLFMPARARVLMVPPQSPHLQWRSQASWYGSEPKHGNVLITDSRPTIIDSVDFQRADALFAVSTRLYGGNSFLHAQLRILIVLHRYFGEHPTTFCKTFFFHGSDKALSWHNYGFVYNFLLGRMAGGIRDVLEVGIGTDHLDVPSTMGATGVPGASLRAWKENFPFSEIVGADMDVRILFQEPGIETYWVDQTNPGAVTQLFDNIGKRRFDLIIDDGLHTFHANRTLMDGAYSHVVAGGFYIIEDVADADVASWEQYLEASCLDAAIVAIPHPTNHTDNRLIFIPGGQR